MTTVKVLGIDLAKQVFQLHGVDGKGIVVLKKRLSRNKLVEFIAQLPPCLIGLEACGGAHYWVFLPIPPKRWIKESLTVRPSVLFWFYGDRQFG